MFNGILNCILNGILNWVFNGILNRILNGILNGVLNWVLNEILNGVLNWVLNGISVIPYYQTVVVDIGYFLYYTHNKGNFKRCCFASIILNQIMSQFHSDYSNCDDERTSANLIKYVSILLLILLFIYN